MIFVIGMDAPTGVRLDSTHIKQTVMSRHAVTVLYSSVHKPCLLSHMSLYPFYWSLLPLNWIEIAGRVQVAAGRAHTLAVSAAGAVYSFGRGIPFSKP
jgi:hypothetical protein